MVNYEWTEPMIKRRTFLTEQEGVNVYLVRPTEQIGTIY